MRAAIGAGALVVSGLLLIAATPTSGDYGSWLYVIGGSCFIGSLFGHVAAAGIWMAMGPGRVYWRIPLAIVWLVLLVFAVGVNRWLSFRGSDLLAILAPIKVYVIAASLVVQAPFLLMQWPGRLSLQRRIHVDEQSNQPNPTDWPRQFGIWQLLVLTTVIGFLLGAGRAVLPLLSGAGAIALAFIAFCGTWAILQALPLVPAILLPRQRNIAVILLLILPAFASLATWREFPLISQVFGAWIRVPFESLALCNGITAGWLLLFASYIRWSGYCLFKPMQREMAIEGH